MAGLAAGPAADEEIGTAAALAVAAGAASVRAVAAELPLSDSQPSRAVVHAGWSGRDISVLHGAGDSRIRPLGGATLSLGRSGADPLRTARRRFGEKSQ